MVKKKKIKRNKNKKNRNYFHYIAILIILSIIIIPLLFFDMEFGIIGFAIFQTSSQSNFDEGTYTSTFFNNSGFVQLNAMSSSGSYISKVFDAGSNVNWNNLTWQGNKPEVEFLYAVDGSGSVYSSSDLGITWNQRTSDYGRGSNTKDMFTENNYLYILFSNSNKEVYSSSDLGVTWSIINNSFTNKKLLVGDVDSNKNLYIATGPGNVFKSADLGTTWMEIGDFNGADNSDAKGIAVNSQDVIFIVDSSGAVYASTNNGIDWVEKTDGYGGGGGTDDMAVDSSGNLYILFDRKVYNSIDNGVTWGLVNESFIAYNKDGLAMTIDKNDNLYIIDEAGKVFKSADLGTTWMEIGDFNGADNNDVKGFTNFIANSYLTLQVRNCSLPDCSDSNFIGPDGTGNSYYSDSTSDFSLEGRYFQYKFKFETDDVSYTPELYNVTVYYSSLCTENWVEINESCQPNYVMIGWYNDSNDCYAITGLELHNNPPVNNTYACDYIISNEFSGSTTNFTEVDLSNITNLVLEVEGYGKINFTKSININQSLDLDTFIKIKNSSIFLNSTILPQFNKSAILSLYNLNFVNPMILINDEECSPSICTKINYENGTLVFNVSGFSTYSVSEGPYCGDNTCNNGETCSTCSADCGSCGGGTSSSTGSGGKSWTSSKFTPSEPNEESVASTGPKEEVTSSTETGILFDVSSDLTKSKIILGEDLTVKISLIKFGVLGKVNVDLDYVISDLENNTILTEKEEITAETRVEFIKTIKLPPDIKAGDYRFSVKLTYDGKEAISQNSFQIVKEEKPSASSLGISLQNWIVMGIILILIIAIILWKRKEHYKKGK